MCPLNTAWQYKPTMLICSWYKKLFWTEYWTILRRKHWPGAYSLFWGRIKGTSSGEDYYLGGW